MTDEELQLNSWARAIRGSVKGGKLPRHSVPRRWPFAQLWTADRIYDVNKLHDGWAVEADAWAMPSQTSGFNYRLMLELQDTVGSRLFQFARRCQGYMQQLSKAIQHWWTSMKGPGHRQDDWLGRTSHSAWVL